MTGRHLNKSKGKPCSRDNTLLFLLLEGVIKIKEVNESQPERHCDGCPYPGTGFICGTNGECMQTRVREIIKKEDKANGNCGTE